MISIGSKRQDREINVPLPKSQDKVAIKRVSIKVSIKWRTKRSHHVEVAAYGDPWTDSLTTILQNPRYQRNALLTENSKSQYYLRGPLPA
ncbi:hypothetical protein V1477_017674 [Vespula maculifrons]|uniref:Uncharacterized protein n=1 Tax=Vespula maculifrons TaxID=7453 RepID=A0ABD2B6N5_VESMC